MHALNPLVVSGCASHQIYLRASIIAPEGGVSSHDIKLKKGKTHSVDTLSRGTPIYVTTQTLARTGPLLTYGVDYKRGLLFASRRVSGHLMTFSFGEIKEIQVIKESKAGAGAGWGALVGGVLGAAVGGAALDDGGIKTVCGVVLGAPVGLVAGMGAGMLGGALAGLDREYQFGEGKWRVAVPAEPPAPDAEPTSLDKATPDAEESEQVEVPEADAPHSYAPPAPADTKKDASTPDVEKKD
jgi:hypothetical protein